MHYLDNQLVTWQPFSNYIHVVTIVDKSVEAIATSLYTHYCASDSTGGGRDASHMQRFLILKKKLIAMSENL